MAFVCKFGQAALIPNVDIALAVPPTFRFDFPSLGLHVGIRFGMWMCFVTVWLLVAILKMVLSSKNSMARWWLLLVFVRVFQFCEVAVVFDSNC